MKHPIIFFSHVWRDCNHSLIIINMHDDKIQKIGPAVRTWSVLQVYTDTVDEVIAGWPVGKFLLAHSLHDFWNYPDEAKWLSWDSFLWYE